MVTADMKFVSTGNNSEPPNLMGAAMLSSRDAHPSPPKLGLRGSKCVCTYCPARNKGYNEMQQAVGAGESVAFHLTHFVVGRSCQRSLVRCHTVPIGAAIVDCISIDCSSSLMGCIVSSGVCLQHVHVDLGLQICCRQRGRAVYLQERKQSTAHNGTCFI